MPDIDLDAEEDCIAQMAVQALAAANRRAIDSGRSVLVVVDDALVRIGSSGTIVLKKIPAGRKVGNRVKRASK